MKSLWPEPQDPNPAGALSGYVGAGAPLVAGFELAALVLLIVSPGVAADVPLIGPLMVAMVTSAALLVFSIRYGFWAVSYWTTLAERLMWDPAAVVADLPLQRQRHLLTGRMLEFGKLRRRAEHLFQIGIFVFLIAVALSCSMPAPATSSRHLYTGHRQGSTQAAPWLRARASKHAPLSREFGDPPGFDAIVPPIDASAVVHTRSSSRRPPDPLTAGLSRNAHHPGS
jgi:hypothetical protein